MDMTGKLVGVVMFASLIGVIAELISTAVANLTGATATIVGLTTLFIAIGFIKSVVPKGK